MVHVLPFTAIVGLDQLKLALLVNVVDPTIGGLLIRGPKGTGKSTAVRALEDLLPEIEVVKGCRFSCNPHDPTNMCEKCRERYERGERLPIERRKMRIITLPLSATEDRVVGSIDVEKALKCGIEAFKPGVLADANQNILYIDEINLLPDHLVDDLLDTAASGWNIVEREGVSVRHPSRFILIGTMNPEEGELRPQLLDRLALSVTIDNIRSVEDRIEIVRRNAEFENDPENFYKKYAEEQRKLREKILKARSIISNVKVPGRLLEAISKMCVNLQVDGVRPDIVIYKTARAIAALDNRTTVTEEDVLKAAKLALQHRTRKKGFLNPPTEKEIEDTFKAVLSEIQLIPYLSKRSKEASKDSPFASSSFVTKKSFIPASEKRNYTTGTQREEDRSEEEVIIKGWKKKRFKLKSRVLLIPILAALTYLIIKWSTLILATFIVTIPLILVLYLLSKKSPKKVNITDDAENLNSKGKRIKSGVFEKLLAVKKIFSKIKSSSFFKGLTLLAEWQLSIFKDYRALFKLKERDRIARQSVGKRALTISKGRQGKIIGWKTPKGTISDIHIPATIRAAAAHGASFGKNGVLKLSKSDLRERIYAYYAPITIMLILDLSDSMSVTRIHLREVLRRIYQEAYRYRDKLGIVALKDAAAAVIQPPTRNLRIVAGKMRMLKVSGYTPLASGILEAIRSLHREKLRDPETIPMVVILTDGFANIPLRMDPVSGEIRPFTALVKSSERNLAIKDVISTCLLLKKAGIHTVVINPDPNAETYRMSDEDVLKIYQLAFVHGKFNGTVFVREVEKRWESPAIGPAVTRLMAILSGGKLYIASSIDTAKEIANIIGSERDMLAKRFAYEKMQKIVYM